MAGISYSNTRLLAYSRSPVFLIGMWRVRVLLEDTLFRMRAGGKPGSRVSGEHLVHIPFRAWNVLLTQSALNACVSDSSLLARKSMSYSVWTWLSNPDFFCKYLRISVLILLLGCGPHVSRTSNAYTKRTRQWTAPSSRCGSWCPLSSRSNHRRGFGKVNLCGWVMNAPSSHYIQLCLFITHGLKLLMVPGKAFKIPHTVVACPTPRRSVSPHVRIQMRGIWDPHTDFSVYWA